MEFKASDLAMMLDLELLGNKDISVNNISGIEKAGANDLSFIANPKYEHHVKDSKAGILIVNKNIAEKYPPVNSAYLISENPYLSFTQLLQQYEKLTKFSETGISDDAIIHESAIIGDNILISDQVSIGKNTSIGSGVKVYQQSFIGNDVKVGDNTIIHPGVKIIEGSEIGSNCIIHPGAVIGSDGFGFAPTEDGRYERIPQLGNVVIEDDVSIGANTTIDRATILGESTVIKKGAKLDNLIQIAHNVIIGENTVIAAKTGISGSTKIGKNCVIGGAVGIAGHLEIAENTSIAAMSGIMKSITEPGKKLMGAPADNFREFFKSLAIYRKLPELNTRLLSVEEKLLNLRQSEQQK